MRILKLTTIRNSVGVILPEEILEHLQIGEGGTLYVIETKRGIELTTLKPKFARQLEMAEQVMREDRGALEKLAK